MRRDDPVTPLFDALLDLSTEGSAAAFQTLQPSDRELDLLLAETSDLAAFKAALKARHQRIYAAPSPFVRPEGGAYTLQIQALDSRELSLDPLPSELPGGYGAIRGRFKPGHPFYLVRVRAPEAIHGVVYDGLFELEAGRVVYLPKAYRALDDVRG